MSVYTWTDVRPPREEWHGMLYAYEGRAALRPATERERRESEAAMHTDAGRPTRDMGPRALGVVMVEGMACYVVDVGRPGGGR